MRRFPHTPSPAAAAAAAQAHSASRRAALYLGGSAALVGALGFMPAWWPAAHAADLPSAAAAVLPTELASSLPGAQLLGSARLRFFGLDIYEARLWVSSGFQAAAYADSPFALELNYFRALSGPLIAERSLKEMRRQGNFGSEREQAWLETMQQAFPDVKAGDRITGLHTPGVGARFWHNGQLRPGSATEQRPDAARAEFSKVFFGIWLSDATSEPELRKRLIGRPAT